MKNGVRFVAVRWICFFCFAVFFLFRLAAIFLFHGNEGESGKGFENCSSSISSQKEMTCQPVQRRKDVTKEFLLASKGGCIPLSLSCKESAIFYNCEGGEKELIEEMVEVSGEGKRPGASFFHFPWEKGSGLKERGVSSRLAFQMDHLTYDYGKSIIQAQKVFFREYLEKGIPSSAESGITLTAERAKYEKPYLSLEGQVEFCGIFGKFLADRATFEPFTRPSHLTLEGQVIVAFQDRAKIFCDIARFNEEERVASFFSHSPNSTVLYQELLESPISKGDNSFEVQSEKMSLFFTEGLEENLPSFSVSHLVAENNVKIFQGEIKATADKAFYFCQKEGCSSAILSLHAELNSCCQVTNAGGDYISAKEIHYSPEASIMTFLAPQGTFQAVLEKEQKEEIHFSGGILCWNADSNQLKLKEHSHLFWKGFSFQAEEFEAVSEGTVRFLKSRGPLRMATFFDDSPHPMTLTSTGDFVLDTQKREILISSFSDGHSPVAEGDQILIRDSMGEVWADSALIKYEEKEGTFVISSIDLNGDVSIFNRRDKTTQYILADQALYRPLTKELELNSTTENRVLFYDKSNQIEISAPGLKIERDNVTKNESVQGRGDVRLRFVEKELAHLREKFHE